LEGNIIAALAKSVQFETLAHLFGLNTTQFLAPQDGWHRIVVRKYRAGESSNYLGIALVRIPLPYRVYLPVVMKNYP